MATLESLLSEQILGNLAADILAPQPPTLGLIQALQFVDGLTPKGKTRITLNWTAPTRWPDLRPASASMSFSDDERSRGHRDPAVRALVETLDARIRSDSITPGPAAP